MEASNTQCSEAFLLSVETSSASLSVEASFMQCSIESPQSVEASFTFLTVEVTSAQRTAKTDHGVEASSTNLCVETSSTSLCVEASSTPCTVSFLQNVETSSTHRDPVPLPRVEQTAALNSAEQLEAGELNPTSAVVVACVTVSVALQHWERTLKFIKL